MTFFIKLDACIKNVKTVSITFVFVKHRDRFFRLSVRLSVRLLVRPSVRHENLTLALALLFPNGSSLNFYILLRMTTRI